LRVQDYKFVGLDSMIEGAEIKGKARVQDITI
jgi:hypothetical protein